jgi:hypothetical protein
VSPPSNLSGRTIRWFNFFLIWWMWTGFSLSFLIEISLMLGRLDIFSGVSLSFVVNCVFYTFTVLLLGYQSFSNRFVRVLRDFWLPFDFSSWGLDEFASRLKLHSSFISIKGTCVFVLRHFCLLHFIKEILPKWIPYRYIKYFSFFGKILAFFILHWDL